MIEIPSQLSGILTTVTQGLGDFNILGEDTAGQVLSLLDVAQGKGEGLTPSIQAPTPTQTVSSVSADAPAAVQKAQMDPKIMMMIGGGVGLVVLLLLLRR